MTPAFAFLTGFFPPLSIAAANGAVILLLITVGLMHALGREKVTPAPTGFEAAILFFMAVWALSSAAGLLPGKGFSRILSQARFIPFFLLAWTGGGKHRDRAFQGYLWGAGLAVLWGLLQIIWDGWYREGLYPWFFNAFGEKGLYYLIFKAGRIHGGVHPLTYAELILPFFFFGTIRFLEAVDGKDMLKRALWPVSAGAALLFSQSRGPWLAAGAGIVFLLAFHPRRLRLALPVALAAGIFFFHPEFQHRVAAARGAVPDQSRSHRLILWNNAWEVCKRHWALGVGPGNLARAVELHRTEPGFVANPWGKDGDAHNQYLHHLAERGVLGLLALIGLMAVPAIKACRTLRAPAAGDPPPWVTWGLAAFFLTFPIINLTERVMDDAEPALVFWLLASLLVKTREFSASSEASDKR